MPITDAPGLQSAAPSTSNLSTAKELVQQPSVESDNSEFPESASAPSGSGVSTPAHVADALANRQGTEEQEHPAASSVAAAASGSQDHASGCSTSNRSNAISTANSDNGAAQPGDPLLNNGGPEVIPAERDLEAPAAAAAPLLNAVPEQLQQEENPQNTEERCCSKKQLICACVIALLCFLLYLGVYSYINEVSIASLFSSERSPFSPEVYEMDNYTLWLLTSP